MNLAAACGVSALTGFIALSYEILWVRVYDFMSEGAPQAFGYLLGAYLAGLGVGAMGARRWCGMDEDGPGPALAALGPLLAAASLIGFAAIPAAATLVAATGGPVVLTLGIFGGAAGLLGAFFPLLAHSAVAADAEAGRRLSFLYVANIAGSAAGSLLTGFVLLELLPLRGVSLVLAVTGLWLAASLVLVAGPRDRARVRETCLTIGVATVVVFGLTGRLHDRLWERLQFKGGLPDERFAHVLENRSGVITATVDGILYGGGSYDGTYNVSPLPQEDQNRVVRAYAVAAFHPRPREVLMIGLGTGSWAQVLAHHPDVERITVVEINPGYVEMLGRYSTVKSLLQNPKVEFVADDGRRFMNATDRKYDLIVQNTIVYWRSHATSLLSREYMQLTARRLKPGGLVYYNTTMSVGAQRTGAEVFPYAVRYQNMLIAGRQPITVDRERWRRALRTWRIDGRPVVPEATPPAVLDAIVDEAIWRGGPAWEDRASILARTEGVPPVTDDNMATEWWLYGTYPE